MHGRAELADVSSRILHRYAGDVRRSVAMGGAEERLQRLVVAQHAPLFRTVSSAPGVYTFYDGDGVPLYVGKSKSLRRRLQSYFGARPTERRKAKMVQLFASSVEVERTGSHFAALLREIELVQQLRPRFNRRLRYPARYAYIGIDFRAPFPRLDITTRPWSDGRFLGPFAARQRMRHALEEVCAAFGLRTCGDPLPSAAEGRRCWRYRLRTCLAPCQGQVTRGQYGRALLQALQTLAGSQEAVRRWQAERTQLAEALAFERAQRLLQREQRVRAAQKQLGISMWRGDDAFVIQPGLVPDSVSLWAIRDGDVAAVVSVAPKDALGAFGSLYALFAQPRAALRFVSQTALDRRWVIFRWLRSGEGAAWSVPVRGRGRAAVEHHFAKIVGSLPHALVSAGA